MTGKASWRASKHDDLTWRYCVTSLKEEFGNLKHRFHKAGCHLHDRLTIGTCAKRSAWATIREKRRGGVPSLPSKVRMAMAVNHNIRGRWLDRSG